jgi:DNA-binding SARP family transcriptional activator
MDAGGGTGASPAGQFTGAVLRMEFRILGAVEVLAPHGPLTIGPPQRLTVLAALLVDVGRPVSPETLLERVWDEPSEGARRSLHAHITRLRQVLRNGSESLGLVRRSGGYLLSAAPDRVDLHRFRQLTGVARDPQRSDEERASLLRQALGLWRGTPLADVSGNWANRVREGLLRQRLDAALTLADIELRLERHLDVIELARDLLIEYPLAEPLHAALMRALTAAGREAEALDSYPALRARLRDQLGVEPGAQLQKLHQSILRREPPPATTAKPPISSPTGARPRCLPRDLADFTGRESVLRQLLDAVPTEGQAATAPMILAIDGMPGVGKTTLAVHLAHLVADRYPDAHLHVDLLGHSTQAPLDPAAALDALLRQLGVRGERIPERIDERINLWRSELAARRVLLLLDNAASTDQIAALVPAEPGCLTLVTSRGRLGGLDGARLTSLHVFTTAEAVVLQQRIVGDRVVVAPQAAQDVARRCGHLPLAIRLAAARLAYRPAWGVPDLADRLRNAQAPLQELALQGRTVEAAFALSYQQLRPATQTLFRRLELYPGPNLGASAAAALADLDLPDADDLLTELVDGNLIEEPAPGRYRLHDLLREYAGQLATADPPDDRHAATGRLLDMYLHTSAAAATFLDPDFVVFDYELDRPPRQARLPADANAGLAWFNDERPNLLAAVQLAADEGRHGHTWRLTRALWRDLCNHGYDDACVSIHQLAIEAAERAGESHGLAISHNDVAFMHHRRCRWEQALHHIDRAIAIRTARGDHAMSALALANKGSVLHLCGRYEEALDAYRGALTLLRQHPDADERLLLSCYTNMGQIYVDSGDHAAAEENVRLHLELAARLGSEGQRNLGYACLAELRLRQGRLEEAVELASKALEGDIIGTTDPRMRALSTLWLGAAYRGLGRLRDAMRCHRQAVSMMEASGSLYGLCDAHVELAATLHAWADDGAALDQYRHALDIARRLKLPRQIGLATAGIAMLNESPPEGSAG